MDPFPYFRTEKMRYNHKLMKVDKGGTFKSLDRIEKRLIFKDKEIFKYFGRKFQRMEFSENKYVQTIYFNNDDHVLPYGLSIKARRYLSNNKIKMPEPSDEFILEFKYEKGDKRSKERTSTYWREIPKIIAKRYNFGNVLRPYIITSYFRDHYTNNEGDLRITLDQDTKYFYVENNQTIVPLGSEKFIRLEIKDFSSQNKHETIFSDLRKIYPLIPINSKKGVAYRYLKSYLSNKYGRKFKKEIRDIEIESKISIEDPDIFIKVKDFFKHNKQYSLTDFFPYTLESSSINKYFRNNGVEYKFMLSGDQVKIVEKSKLLLLKGTQGIKNIVKRREKKAKKMSVWEVDWKIYNFEKELFRVRKAFWVINNESKRFYHLTIDECFSGEKKFTQLEIEYTGTFGKNERDLAERKIITDISSITKLLLGKFFQLIPTSLTKYEWLTAL